MHHALKIVALSLLLFCTAVQAQSTANIAAYEGADRQARLLEGAKKEGALTLYATTPIEYLRVIIAAFESKYGVKVNLWRSRSENVLQRIVSEARGGKPAFDVVECITPPMEALRMEGLLLGFKKSQVTNTFIGRRYDNIPKRTFCKTVIDG